jgi:hypothetical protein
VTNAIRTGIIHTDHVAGKPEPYYNKIPSSTGVNHCGSVTAVESSSPSSVRYNSRALA